MLRIVLASGLVVVAGLAQAQERLIVKFRESGFAASASAQQIREQMARPFSQSRMQSLSNQARVSLKYSHPVAQTGAHVLRLPEGADAQQMQAVIDSLKRLPDIAYVEQDKRLYRKAAPNDPEYTNLWGMQPVNSGSARYGANFENAWPLTTGSGVVVAVVDTGILPHPDIGSITLGSQTVTGNLVSAGYDFISDCRDANTCAPTTSAGSAARSPVNNAFDQGDWLTSTETAIGQYFQGCDVVDSSWHGTHVAGTIAALGNNSTGVIGGAYGAKILPVRALGRCGGFTSDIAAGILWAAGVHGTIPNPNPAKVINMSLGGYGSCSPTFQNAIDAATAAGAVVVVAAGNSNSNVSTANPANCSDVIAVAATGRSGNRASYSNYGSLVALAAPGGDGAGSTNSILSTLNSGTRAYSPSGFNYVAYEGTSMATPHVSAAVALLKANIPSITTTQARAVLQATVTSFPAGSTCTTSICGAGILNAAQVAAVDISTPTAAPASINFGQVSAGTNSSTQTITITNPSANGSLAGGLSYPAVFGTVTLTPAANFSVISDTCSGTSVSAGGTCTVGVRFTATSGLSQGSLGLPVTTGGRASTASVSLSGTSTRKLGVASASIWMGTVNAGATTSSTVTFTNDSGGDVTLGAASVTPASVFAISTDSCSNTTLAASATCSVDLRATPSSAGTYSGTLSLNTTGVGDTPSTVSLSGTATSPSGTSPTPSSGGGGGSLGWLTLAFLLAALGLARRVPGFQ